MLKGKNKKVEKRRNIIEEEGNESGTDSEEETNEREYKGGKATKKRNAGINKILSKKNELKLRRIVLENFKSFEGRHEVGYFLNFSVVLGPNGSGKSNIIDAICFALGMKTISLRTKNLRDLVYKKEVDDDNSRRSSAVELHFSKDGDELVFKRTITSKGSSEFFSNDAKVSADDYLKQLENLDIPSKARYFILVQGAIDSILSKKNDLTEAIEFLSDSYLHKEDYEKAKGELKALTDEIGKLSNEMHSIKDDRNRVKTQIENEAKYNELNTKLNETLNKIYLHKLAEMDLTIETNEQKLNENEESMRTVQDDKKSLIEFIKTNELEVRKVESELKKVDSSEGKKLVEDLSNKLTQCNENIKLYESQVFGKLSLLNQYKNDKANKDEKKSQLLTQAKTLDKQIEDVKTLLNLDTGNLSQNLDITQVNEYREISHRVEIETFQINKEAEKIHIQISEVNNQRTILDKNLNKVENEKSALESELSALKEKIKTEEMNKSKCEIETLTMKGLLSSKDSAKLQLESEWEVKCKLLNEKLVQLSNQENENLENTKKRKISELINLNKNVSGFLYELITPLQKKLELPIKISLLKYLNYLVVENSETAKLCSEYLKSKEISSDVLVLENIPENENDESVRLRLGNLGNLVVDLIDCKKKGLKNALNYFLKDMVLCYDKENVSKIKSKGFNSIILTDGTTYKKGSIRGGNYKNIDQFSFNYKGGNPQEIDKLRTEVEALTREVHNLEEKRNDYRELTQLKSKILEKDNMTEVHSKNLMLYKNNLDNLKVTIAKKEEVFSEFTNTLDKLKKEHADLTSQLEVVNRKIKDLKDNFFTDFMKKNNLSSLKDFEPFSLKEIKRLSEELKSYEEKLLKTKSQIKSLEEKEELILKLENNLNDEKQKKKQFELEKEKLEKEHKAASVEYENYLAAKNEEFKKISQMKELLKLKQNELDQLDKRIRSLLKNKIEYEHIICNSIDSKRNIIEESKLNIDSYIKDLNDIIQSYSVFVTFNVDIERFILASETKFNRTNLMIDFSGIETKRKINEVSAEGHKEKVEGLKTKFSDLMKELEKYVKLCSLNEDETNKLKDKEEELNRKKKQTSLQVQNIVNELEAKKEEFGRIKRERKEKFEGFFNKLSSKLTATYKDMTTPQDSLSVGGSAYIYNTNEDEPYLGSVCYLPTPPGKRVIYDIDQLSGGEKTIAILSLVISLQSICLTPFIVLDEIDSYLDPEHEAILERLFKTQNKNFQIIIVTHKPTIFRSADSLIGTYFNKQKFSSVPISVDMTKIC